MTGVLKDPEYIEICGIRIIKADSLNLNERITAAISGGNRISITYCNASTVNRIIEDGSFLPMISSFDIIHPDGTGIFLASKFLFGSQGLRRRFSGSDYYQHLIDLALIHKLRIFFFGHDEDTLKKISVKNPGLNIAGYYPGYNYSDEKVISMVNQSSPDILVIGLGFPLQEHWIVKNSSKINCRVVIAVGDGIKVFAGTKIRGPKILRMIGMEWFVRFLSDPIRYFRRYIIGNPLFLYRIIKYKFRKFG